MTKRSFDTLKNLLKNLGIYLKSHRTLSQSNIKKSMLILESIFSDPGLSLRELEELIKYNKENNLLSLFQKTYEIYEINLEKEFAKSFIKGKNNDGRNKIKKYRFYDGYFTAVKKEVRLAKISANDKVSFIGSGPMPMTPILLYELTSVNVDCIEKDKQSIELSKKVIEKLAYNQHIKIKHKNALREDFSKYNVIVLAVMTKPKAELMKRIWNQVLLGTRIVYRLPSIARQAYYEDSSEVLNNYIEFEKKRIIGKGTSTLVLLVKN